MNRRRGSGELYDGYRRNDTIGGTFRMNEHANFSLSDQINDIELGSGAFVTHLVTGRVNDYFNTKVFVNASQADRRAGRQVISGRARRFATRPSVPVRPSFDLSTS